MPSVDFPSDVPDNSPTFLVGGNSALNAGAGGPSKAPAGATGVALVAAANPATGRAVLGLDSAATQPASAFLAVSGNLSDVASPPTALANLGVGKVTPVSAPTVLTAAMSGNTLTCTGTPQLTINAGLPTGFGVVLRGLFTYVGSATVVDERVALAAVFTAALVQTGTDTYVLVGSKE